MHGHVSSQGSKLAQGLLVVGEGSRANIKTSRLASNQLHAVLVAEGAKAQMLGCFASGSIKAPAVLVTGGKSR